VSLGEQEGKRLALLQGGDFSPPPRNPSGLSARAHFSKEAQAHWLFAGANSIFYGDKLLTGDNPRVDQDRELLSALDLAAQPPFAAERG
jgi:biotin synthase